MAVNFRCEECGKLLGTEAEPGSTIKCTQCGKKVTVPAGLASFPRPRISSDVEPAEPAHPQAPQQLEPQEGAVVLGVMAYIMPWVISVFFHLGLILIMFFVVMFFEASQIPQDKIVPDAELVDNFGGRMSDSSYSRKLQTQRQRLTKEYHSETSMLSMAKTEDETKILGTTDGAGGGSGFGIETDGAGAGLGSTMFGSRGGNCYHIVYVIDRSGSMLDTFDFVRREMARSIGKLQKVQDFHVILFAAGPPMENRPQRLVFATEDNKREVSEFLMGAKAWGQTDPVPAIEKAFAVLAKTRSQRKGKLIHLLTDGDFPDNEKVLDAIRAHNRKKDVHINTYLYGNRPPKAVEVMEKIAKENGGRYVFVPSDI